MRVFDFDGTIYDGESCVDFFLYTLRRHPHNITLLPRVLYMLWRYKHLKVSAEELIFQLEKYGAGYLRGFSDINAEVAEFWDKYEYKIKPFYLKSHREDDVILSAGPDFLILEIARRLKIKTVISSRFDLEKGRIISLCYNSNKYKCFRQRFPNERIDEFYTDSDVDSPVYDIADCVYIVNGNKVRRRRV